jgi:ABC-type uncharacterized transport system ATPase subunit
MVKAVEAENKPQTTSFLSSSQGSPKPIIQLRNITKRFPGVIALDHINLDIYPGEVHALLGENGAGKSTLVKVLYGIYTPDEGEIIVNGAPVTIASPRDAMDLGITMVSQSPQVIDRLTIAENMILSLKKYGVMSSLGKVGKEILEKEKMFGVKIDPNTEVWKLSYTQKQIVEFIRAMLLGAKVILIDEALTYLPIEEKKRFYKFMEQFVKMGGSVILITHKIYEALESAHRITVLRRGRNVGTILREEATIDKVREMMFGERSKEITYERLPPGNPGETILDIKDVWVKGDFGEDAVQGATLAVRKGEVVGIAGVAGNGQKELIQAVMRIRDYYRGSIVFEGTDLKKKTTYYLRLNGVGYIPDLPARYGVSIENTITENIAVLPTYARGIIDWEKIRGLALKLIKELEIKTPSPETPVKYLSGGNIMKVLVARELNTATKLLVAYNPTRALDEATAIRVRRIIKDKVIKEGIGALIASEDLDEIFQLADTILVMNSGKIVGSFKAEEAKREEVEKLMVM